MKSLTNNEALIEQQFKEINRLTDRRQLKKALKLCEALFELYPDHPRVLHGVGMLRYRTGAGRQEGELLLRRAIQLKPDFADAYYSLGIMMHNAVLQDDAEKQFRAALEYESGHYKAMTSLATVLTTKGQMQEAQKLSEKALTLNPRYAPIYHNLGTIMQAYGRMDEAIINLRKSLEISKLDSAYSCLLFAMNLVPTFSQKEIFEESARWGRIYSRLYARKIHGHLNSPIPERRMRIGYVSGDLKLHPVTFHFKPVLASHNKRNVEIFLYNSFPHVDELTEEQAGYADIYRDISSMSDEKAEALIRKDGIDILIDLSGHTGFQRLGLFVRKPAPVQVSWLGYFNTTGLTSIDYLISDPITTPPSEDKYFTEQVFRLPNCRFCYQPMPNAPDVAPTPALHHGRLTFGSFNGIQKISSEVIALWSRLLQVIPDARIVLKSKQFKDEMVTDDFLRKFSSHGVAAERIELRHNSSYSDMLAEYGDIDLALDTFPYNGGATTCEALWMGVPVVTLECGTPISRQSKAFLHTIGYPEWVASTADEYIETIQCLTSDVGALQLIRAGLRQRMADSPLCNAKTFTEHLEVAYRRMWQRWCSESKPVESFRPFSADELCAAGYNYLEDGDVQQSVELFNRTLSRNPGHVHALTGLGKTFSKMGDYSSAVKTFRKSIRRDPSYFYSYFNLGFTLLNSAKLKEARRVFLRALAINPEHIETLVNLCVTNKLLGRLSEAQNYCEKALEICPNHVGALGHLAFVSGDQGNIPRAIETLKMAMELEPDNLEILSGLISYLNYRIDTDQKDICELSVRIGSVFEQKANCTHFVSASSEARNHLRIGLVSPDFGRHPVGQLLVALFKEYNPELLSLYCYSNRRSHDPLTEWYRETATAWRDITKMSDVEAAELIRNDKIDVLVDLSGHTTGHRLSIFSQRPAPVQASWMGFGHTTGLTSIDFIIADDDFIRPQDEQWFSEQIVRLPFNRFCFVPPNPCPEVVEPPLYDNDYITFGSFNNPMKISEQVVAVWAQILLGVPRSRMILKYKAFRDSSVLTRYQDLFAKYGVARSRIEFRKPSNLFFMMMEYGDIDIALDPFPFTGGMTSLFSLWMGVPIVTLSGELPISRQTESFLKLVGLQDMVATSDEEYISNAIKLSQNHSRLCEVRSTLRNTMFASPLCDAKGHAASLKHLFFDMWRSKVGNVQKK